MSLNFKTFYKNDHEFVAFNYFRPFSLPAEAEDLKEAEASFEVLFVTVKDNGLHESVYNLSQALAYADRQQPLRIEDIDISDKSLGP